MIGCNTGVTLRTLSGDVRKVIARITSVMQDHYPETLGKTCIINAPFYFQAVWALVKPLLQPRTVNKVTLLGTHYMDELTKFVDIGSIPEYMGGKCRNTLLDDPGPWNDPQVLSNLGMINEENPDDYAAEHLSMNEIDSADSPRVMRAPKSLPHTAPEQSPRTPDVRTTHCVFRCIFCSFMQTSRSVSCALTCL
jgi:CRAL/TRIO domain